MVKLSLTRGPRLFNEKIREFSQMVVGKLDIYMQKYDTGFYIMPYKKINSKCNKDLNIRPKIVKL